MMQGRIGIGVAKAGLGCSTRQNELELGQAGPSQAAAPAGGYRGETSHANVDTVSAGSMSP